MKRLLLLSMMFVWAVSASAQWVNTSERTSFNYLAPEGATQQVNEILFPISEIVSYDFDTNDTVEVEISQMFYLFSVDTVQGNMWINVTLDDQVTPGALFLGTFPGDTVADRKIYFETGFYADSITVDSATIKYPTAIYDGTSFRLVK